MKKLVFFYFMLFCITSYAQICNTSYKYALGSRFYVDIPNCLEKQDGSYKQLSENFQRAVGVDVSSDRVAFQGIGTNDFKKPNFVRVIYNSHYFGPGELKKLGSPFTQAELTAQSNAARQAFANVNSVKILSWGKPVNVKIGNLYAMKLSYTRQLSDRIPAVVSIYYIQDYDKMHEITTSYNQAEAEIWKPVMAGIVSSLEVQ